ncbi:MAG: GNAT family N-acetyltransferase [Candidatus Marinimicrobia bacterium]|nr:GNAT family N-acetyltransferase [Candidatus Neomarinimicrobiota bacterium]
MSLQFRKYTNESGFTDDFHAVRKFLVRINEKNPIQSDFEWGRWEWAFSLPYLETSNLSKIGIWESDGKIVALVTYEQGLGTAYFCIDKEYNFLKLEMLMYAGENFCNEEGKLKVLINNTDREFQKIAFQLDYKPTQDTETNAIFDIDVNSTEYSLPLGYSIISLAEDYDIEKFHRVLWRGFNHEGEPPTTDEELENRRKSVSGPDLNPELCIIVMSPEGEYASYCGMWYDRNTEYALVEPVATDPKYRKLGLGKAAVLEAIRRCGQLGAKQAYVGSSQQFYYQIGFRPIPASTFWEVR